MAGCVAGSQYIPSVEYFVHWIHHGTMIFEAHENFQKRSWRNKSAILGPNQPIILSVPLLKGKHHQMPIQNVEISYDESWHKIHFRTIQSVYGKTAFFEEIETGIRDLLYSQTKFLWTFNLDFIQQITSLIPGKWDWKFSDTYNSELPNNAIDLRQGIAAGISSLPPNKIPTYEQVQRLSKSHQPNLSILDVLCHLGPGTREYLTRYEKQLYNITT